MTSIAHRLLLAVVLVGLVGPAHAQDDTRLLRHPAVSDAYVAFAYANDLWVVERGTPEARRLTSFPGQETVPHFSPDGSMIAFTGQYDGNTDVYVVPVEGGEPQRLTWHPGGDQVQGWTPDGRVLFTSGRDTAPVSLPSFWTVGMDGRMPQELPIPRGTMGQVSPDGTRLAYQFPYFFDAEWRNYRGGQALPLRIVDLETLDMQKLPWEGSRQVDPVWLGETIYFLSERDLVMNVYAYDTQTGDLRQVTSHDDYDVKRLDAGGGVIVYEQGGRLHQYDPSTDVAEPLAITVRGDLPWARPQWEDVSDDVQHATLSPTGQRALVEARGEIFTVPAEKGDWRNLTKSSGAADRAPAWSPDGSQIAWFSDASGEYQLMIADQKGLEAPRAIDLPGPTFYYTPAWSPEGTHILFTDTDLNLWVLEVDSGEATLVDTDQYAHPVRSLDPVWSPDGRWIAYAKRLDNLFRAVMVYSMETGETHQVTDGMSDAMSPAWDAGGTYLYFLASTNLGLNTGWLDMSSYERPVERGVYLAVLAEDEPSPLLPESDEEPGEGEDDENGEANDENGEAENGNENGADDVTVTIDVDGLQQRILALDVPLRDYGMLRAGTDGTVFYAEDVPNQPGMTLHRYSLDDREATQLMEGVRHFDLSDDGEKLLYRAGDAWGIVDASGSPSPGDGALTLDLRTRIDPAREWEQIFDEAWRFQRDYLYVENLHGADWDQVYQMYRPWVEHVRHRDDLNYVLDIMGGEVSVGHSYTGGGDYPDVDRVPIGLLGADLEVADGAYRIARIYTGENWNPDLRAPLSAPGVDVEEGDYLVGVNGEALTAATNLYGAFEQTAGRQTILHVNDRPTMDGARTVTVVPVEDETALRRRAWVEDNRQRVSEMSDGRLAYVYLPNTAGTGYEYFNRYYFAQQDKAGVVIDERFNGGGSAADYMIDIMARELHGYFNNPVEDRTPWTTPMAGIWGPKVMIINESAGSGGDLLPYMFRRMDLGPLVGTRTWGGLVGIWDTPPLIDGGRITAPRGGFFDREGNWAVENEGVAPDIEVEMTPKAVAAGRDPQLERAVQEALRLLEEHPVQLHDEPPPPVRVLRPEDG